MMDQVKEIRAWRMPGVIGVLLAIFLLGLNLVFASQIESQPLFVIGMIGAILAFIFLMPGFLVVQPNEARVLIFLGGQYIGTVRDTGFWWANPLTSKKRVSLRVRNFNSERLKVNDASGNPIEIAAVIVWKVTESAKAVFDVDDYASFVAIQSETAIRTLASHYPYDHEHNASLRGSPDEVANHLVEELKARLEIAGVDVLEARISHLAYAQEIAQAMLRRQQAQAVIAARQMIVEGAVGMVEMALKRLQEQNVIELDEERKAAMVNNLLVALVSERESQPIINTGTLY